MRSLPPQQLLGAGVSPDTARRAEGDLPWGCGIIGGSVALGYPIARSGCGVAGPSHRNLSHRIPCSLVLASEPASVPLLAPVTATHPHTGGLGAGCSLSPTPLGLRWNKGPPTSDKQSPVCILGLAGWYLEPRGSTDVLQETGILIGKKRELLSPDSH